MKLSIKDFFSKCDLIHRKLRIWSHLLKKSLMENFIFCQVIIFVCLYWISIANKKNSIYFTGAMQNLKAVPQNFMDVFKVDDISANDVIQEKQHLLRKENLQISHSNHYCLISIFSIKLLKRLEIWFSFLRE